MSTTTTIGVALITSVVAATVTCLVLSPTSTQAASPDPTSSADPRIDELVRQQAEFERQVTDLRSKLESSSADPRIDELVRQQAEFERRVTDLRSKLESSSARRQPVEPNRTTPELSDQDIERIAALLRPRPDPAEPRFDVAAAVRELQNPAVSDSEKAELWKQLRENGQIDATVERFEQLAAASPNDSMAQTELAWAYQHRMLAAENGPERGKWGSKAATEFAAALELDETNWDARYSLAQHSYWAAMRGDAIRHFEILLQQQPDRTPDPKHAQAYAWLGNILMDRGDAEAARRVWNDGLARFPADATLRERLDAHR